MTATSSSGDQLRPGLWETVNDRYPGSMITKDDLVPLASLPGRCQRRGSLSSSTAGVQPKGTLPFDVVHPVGDYTFRRVPSGSAPADLEIHQLKYPTDGAHRDLNVIFPIERLQELRGEGVIGDLTPSFFSFIGYNMDPELLERTLAEDIADAVRDEMASWSCFSRMTDLPPVGRTGTESDRAARHPNGVGQRRARCHRARQASARRVRAVPDGAPLRCAVPRRCPAADHPLSPRSDHDGVGKWRHSRSSVAVDPSAARRRAPRACVEVDRRVHIESSPRQKGESDGGQVRRSGTARGKARQKEVAISLSCCKARARLR